MKKTKTMKRLLLILTLMLTLALALPAAVFATDAPPTNVAGGTLQIEYRFVEGEQVVIPPEVDRFGFTFRLVSYTDPIPEGTLPETRTYRYTVSGALTEEQLAMIQGYTGGIALTPVYIEYEREVDKETQIAMKTNDVDDVPLMMAFQVTSGKDPSGYTMKELERVGVTFELADPPLDSRGLPAGYIADVVYRGVESYSKIGYYFADTTFTTSETEDGLMAYIVIADYETDMLPPLIDEEEVIMPTEEPEAGGEDDGLLAMVENQTGNPIVDIINGNVPLGSPEITGVWSLLSLIFSVVGLAMAVIYTLGSITKRRYISTLEKMGVYDEGWLAQAKRRGVILHVLTIIAGLITLFAWVILDDFSLGMVWLNSNTLTIGILFAATVALCMFTNMRERKVNEGMMDDNDEKETVLVS